MKTVFGILLAMAVVFAVCLTISNSHSKVLQFVEGSSSEVLADDEGYYYYFCRCHSDGSCKIGSYISFRSQCAYVLSSEEIEVNCSDAQVNCP